MHDMKKALVMAALLGAALCWSQVAPPRAGYYRCKDDQGRWITRDRYIAECAHKEQQLLNPDGSLREVIRPTPTPDERARREEADRAERDAQAAKNDAVKYDRLLMIRFPDDAAHDRARESAQEPLRAAVRAAEERLNELAVERKRLREEAEFYRGRVLPQSLGQQFDANEAAAEAQRLAIRNAQAEMERINGRYDVEHERLRKLRSGADPGSLGPAPP
jgi:hypothetical protein